MDDKLSLLVSIFVTVKKHFTLIKLIFSLHNLYNEITNEYDVDNLTLAPQTL